MDTVERLEEFYKDLLVYDEDDLEIELLREMKLLKHIYEDGNQSALISALHLFCHLERSSMPKWLAEGISDALCKWSGLEVKTLDEAFNAVRRKGFNLNARRKRHDLGGKVYLVVTKMSREGGLPIDDELFELVGGKYNISKTLAKNYYYEIKKDIDKIFEPFLDQTSKKK